MSCQRCEELREEIRFLKRQVAVEAEAAQVQCLAIMFGLAPAEAKMLAALYNARGRVLSPVQLDEIAPAERVRADERHMKHVDVRICRLRKKLCSPEAIKNVWGAGYHLTELGRLIVSEALEDNRAAAPSKSREAV